MMSEPKNSLVKETATNINKKQEMFCDGKALFMCSFLGFVTIYKVIVIFFKASTRIFQVQCNVSLAVRFS